MKKNILFLLIGCLTLLACSSSTKESAVNIKDILGRYAYNQNTLDSILIYSNNTYRHLYYRSDGKLFELSGVWRYDSTISYIFFDDFVGLTDSGPTGLKGTWGPKVLFQEGELRLIYSDENNIYYARQPVSQRN
jgi:hypothetical protein